MCESQYGKKSKFGLKAIVLSCVLLLVACSQVFSWPWDTKKEEVKVDNNQIVQQLEAEKKTLEEQIELANLSLAELQTLLEKQEIQLLDLQSQSPTYQAIIQNSEKESQKLLLQIEQLGKDLEQSKIAYEEMTEKYNTLNKDYENKVKESDGYFKDLSRSQARVEALESDKGIKKFTQMISVSALFQNFKWGVDLTYGVGYKNIYLTVGGQYMLGDPFTFKNLSGLKSIRAKAGVAIIF